MTTTPTPGFRDGVEAVAQPYSAGRCWFCGSEINFYGARKFLVAGVSASYPNGAEAAICSRSDCERSADKYDISYGKPTQIDWPALPTPPAQPDSFQSRVQPWMMECFGPEIAADKIERSHRFIEEALELVQANDCTRGEAHQLVDYVYDRDQGDINQEVGGAMVTLAALCLAIGVDMHAAGETELARVWTKIDKIRAKHAAKPRHSPLPAQPARDVEQVVATQIALSLTLKIAKNWTVSLEDRRIVTDWLIGAIAAALRTANEGAEGALIHLAAENLASAEVEDIGDSTSTTDAYYLRAKARAAVPWKPGRAALIDGKEKS